MAGILKNTTKSFWRKACRRVFCVLLAAFLLVITPASGYLGAKQIKRVDAAAAAAAVGGAALFELLASSVGVAVSVTSLAWLVDKFASWLADNGKQESKEQWEAVAAGNASSVTVGQGLIDDAKSFLGTKIPGGLTSGKVVSYSGFDGVDNGIPSPAPALEAKLLSSLFRTSSSYSIYYYRCYLRANDGGLDVNYICNSYSSPLASPPFVIMAGGIPIFYNLRSDGTMRLLGGNRSWVVVRPDLTFSSVTSAFDRVFAYPFDDSGSSNPLLTVTNVPLIWSKSSSCFRDGDRLSDALASATATYGMDTITDSVAPPLTSFGGYDAAVTSSLAGKTLTAADLAAIKAAVSSAIAENTVTDANGKDTYNDGISAAISAALAAALLDVEEEEKPVEPPVEPDKPEEPQKPLPLVPDVSGILELLKSLYEALSNWIGAIPSAIKAIPGAFKDAFSDVSSAILSIPGILTDGFAGLQAWVPNAGALPTAQSITQPITDTIKDTVTVNPDVVRAAVEAGNTDLWDSSFLSQAGDIFNSIQFSDVYAYPKITIRTPDILRPYYPEPEIVLLDFWDYRDYCLWARLLIRATIWLALVWHIVDLATPRLRIS